jgi:hypothetical protein
VTLRQLPHPSCTCSTCVRAFPTSFACRDAHTVDPSSQILTHLCLAIVCCPLLPKRQYDSVHGKYEGTVEDSKEGVTIDGHMIKVFSQM